MTNKRKWLIGIMCMLLLPAGVYFGLRGTGGEAAAPAISTAQPVEPVGLLTPRTQGKSRVNSAEELTALKAMDQAAENSYLALYVNRETAEVAVRDKKSGYAWFSNPVGRDDDPIASPLYKSEMSSQVTVTYYNEKGQMAAYNSYDESVKKKQFNISQTADGLKIQYVLGKLSAALDGLPKAISKKRMEEKILGKIADASVKESLLYKFKYDEKKQIYELRELKDFVAQEVLQILQKAGYTKEDAAQDNADNGVKGAAAANANTIQFTVPILYSLQDDQLVVTVPANEIKYPKAYPIASLSVLKYFGAAGEHKNGYLFVPDGSGALIRLNNGKLGAEPYSLPVYGDDGTFVVKEKAQENQVSRLPVFGMKQDDHAFIGIIEAGDALANVTADISGRYVSFNSIGSEYRLVNMDYYTLSSGDRTSSVPVFQQSIYAGDIRIRYAFTDGASADYVGMATLYRQYLVQRYGLKRLSSADGYPFILELVGAFRKKQSFLGIPYVSTESLTSYDEAVQLAAMLKKRGVKDIAMRYIGWFNGGVRHSSPSNVTPVGVLGGNPGLKRLVEFTKSNRIAFYPDAAFLEAYQSSSTAAEFLGRGKAKIYEYDPVMHTQDLDKFSHYLVSPLRVPSIVDRFLEDYQRLGIPGVSLRDLGQELNSDYTPAHPVDRQSAMESIINDLSKLNKSMDSLLVNGGNAYSLPYADLIVNASTRSSGINLTDEDVPFYQIALHGYVRLAGQPFNMDRNQNPRLSMLKALETGSHVYFQWFYREPSVVKDTSFNGLYALHYQDWIEDAVRVYQEADGILRDVGDQPIALHRKLAEGVYQTVYENGRSVTVNYNRTAVTIGGITIAPEGYSLQPGGDPVQGGE